MRYICVLGSLCISFSTFTMYWHYADDLIKKFKRPITCLCIGDDIDAFCTKAYQYPQSVFVFLGLQSPKADRIPANIIYLQSKITFELLKKLGESEHFDVVLISNSNLPFNISYVACQIYLLGEHVLLKLPSSCLGYAKMLRKYQFHSVYTSVEVYYAYHPKTYLLRTHWFEEASTANAVRHIISNYNEKTHTKRHEDPSVSFTWIPGINMMTYKALNGIIPSLKSLEYEIKRLFGVKHSDWMPNNMIVQGNKVALIDFDISGIGEKTVQTERMLELTVQFIRDKKVSNIFKNYEAILSYCRQMIGTVSA
jgi:hypothetical protein